MTLVMPRFLFYACREKYRMIIPGILITILTFPGVILHECAHLLFCRIFGVRVAKVCYFRLGNPAGYVLHEAPRNPWHHLWIATGPFFLNSLVGLIIGVFLTLHSSPHQTTQSIVVLWLAISFAMHAFPSTGDARSLWAVTWSRGTPILMKLVATPLIGVIYLFALGSMFWLDIAYGVLLVFFIPRWFLSALMLH